MAATFRTILIMLAFPPLVLLILAHAFPGSLQTDSGWLILLILIGSLVTGMVAIGASGWRMQVRIGVALGYALAAIPVLPFMALLAVCSTGDCL